MTIEIILPLPVSVNQLTHNNNAKNGGRGGRSKTKKAKGWYKHAQVYAMPFMQAHQDLCNRNINERNKYWDFKKKSYDLHKLQTANMGLSYAVVYKYFYAQERHKMPRDIFNYEKQLSDFLTDMGFMLDDSFIDDGRVLRGGTDPNNPRVEIEISEINSLDKQ